MELKLSETQKAKLEKLADMQEHFQNELNVVTQHLEDVTDIILDVHGVSKENIERIAYQDGFFVIELLEDRK